MKLSRKDFLKLGALLPAGGALGRQSQGEQQPKASDSTRPNILVLMSDQHRPDLMTAAGNDLVPTPNIDKIAGRGVRFSRAYCPYPVCAPSRMSFMTGRYPHHHGVVTNNQELDWQIPTIASYFRDQGYATGLIGKMHFTSAHGYGFDYRLSINDWIMYLGPGVQHYADEIASDPAFAMFQSVIDSGSGLPILPDLWNGKSPWAGQVRPKNKLASEIPADRHLEAFVARESRKFMSRCRQSGKPFFLVSGFIKPHAPFYPPPGWAEELYPSDRVGLRPVGDVSSYPDYIQDRIQRYRAMGESRLRFRRAGYLGNVAFMDHCVGEIYRYLEEEDLLNNTIVIYTSDHGEMDSQHGLFQKFLFFEPSVGVPLIVSYPPALPEDKVSRALVDYMGIFPTLVEMTGEAVPPDLDARSFLPFLIDPESKGPEAIYSEYSLSWAPRYMVRSDRHKYILNEGTLDELYDLERDPEENQNLVKDPDYKRVRQDLNERLLAWYDPAQNPFRPERIDRSGGYPPAQITYPPGYERRR